MKIGIGIPNQIRDVDARVLPDWAVKADDAGFSTLGTVGRIAFPGVMDTVALAAAAGATSRIGLFTNVLLGPVWPAVLLAKEIASIDTVSGGRLTLGLGLGARPDDFVVEGLPGHGLGKRLDADVETYRQVWRGEPVGGGPNPAVPEGAREVPILFGGLVRAGYERVARLGEGYVGASVPPATAAENFDGVRAAWEKSGRQGSPRLVAIAYFALGDVDQARRNVYDYYSVAGDDWARSTAEGLSGGDAAIQATVKAFRDIGADELILNPGLDDLDEVSRLADVVL
jgi:alkanesulfonate monooxygenase SsuD/methylene tetrahydromethanopterin reductase-like flavin-dependent oxidoreductase (luciferase family)